MTPLTRRAASLLLLALYVLAVQPAAAQAQTVLDKLKATLHLGPCTPPPASGTPSMVQVGDMIDDIENVLRCEGTVVIQQPSVWGQARMTVYRKKFDEQMDKELANFEFVISARIARSDQATFESQTALAASLTRVQGGKGSSSVTVSTSADVTKERDNMATVVGKLLDKSTAIELKRDDTLSLLDKAFKNLGRKSGQLGVEPTVYLDEEKRYLDHLSEIRRVNLGDDNADSAGYGLYLVRLPVSIEPGHKTEHNPGAILNVTAFHDFGPCFLQKTFRNLVINDLIDQLAPVVYDLVLHDVDKDYLAKKQAYAAALADEPAQAAAATEEALQRTFEAAADPGRHKDVRASLQKSAGSLRATLLATPRAQWQGVIESHVRQAIPRHVKPYSIRLQPSRKDGMENKGTPQPNPASGMGPEKIATELLVRQAKQSADAAQQVVRAAVQSQGARVRQTLQKAALRLGRLRSTTVGGQEYPVTPTDFVDVFLDENLVALAQAVRLVQQTAQPRAEDIRNFLRRELEGAYDLMQHGVEGLGAPLGDTPFIQKVAEDFRERRFADPQFCPLWRGNCDVLMHKLNDRVRCSPLGPLCWAIALDAGLLNEQLHRDIHCLVGCNGFACKVAVDSISFYLPPALADTEPGVTAAQVFQDYVRARWPLVTFSLDPVVDQQNLADAYSLRRELQLAVAYAFSTGRISFSQMNRFQRRIELDAETIALNRTVTVFSHGNDTFGWRFTPRYQNPPQERTNFQSFTNLLLFGGPPRNYQVRNSKLERGQRELTAVIIMPSFLNRIRLDVSGNWFLLTHPGHLTVPTGRMLEQSRRVKEVLDAPAECDAARYRPEDVQHLATRMKRLEQMLPVQTCVVPVPYENTLGGFELFGQGHTALVPKLIGFEGVDTITKDLPADVVLYGKSISIQETKVVASGQLIAPGGVDILSREVVHIQIPGTVQATAMQDGKKFVEVYLATPNGISNRVLIPYQEAKAAAAAAAGGLVTPATPALKVRALWAQDKDAPCGKLRPCLLDPPTVDLSWAADKSITPKKIGLRFSLESAPGKAVGAPAGSAGPLLVEGNDGVFKVPSEILAAPLLEELSRLYKPGDALPDTIKGTVTVVTADGQTVYVCGCKAALQVQLELVPAVTLGPCPCPVPCGGLIPPMPEPPPAATAAPRAPEIGPRPQVAPAPGVRPLPAPPAPPPQGGAALGSPR